MEKLWDFLISIIGLFQFWVIMDAPEHGWVFRFGNPHRYITPTNGVFGSGLHLLYPFGIEESRVAETWEEWWTGPVQSLVLKDGTAVTVQGTFRFKILADEAEKLKTFFLELGDDDKGFAGGFGSAISDIVEIQDKASFAKRETGMNEQIIEEARRNLNRYGLKLYEFRWIQKSAGRQLRVIM